MVSIPSRYDPNELQEEYKKRGGKVSIPSRYDPNVNMVALKKVDGGSFNPFKVRSQPVASVTVLVFRICGFNPFKVRSQPEDNDG